MGLFSSRHFTREALFENELNEFSPAIIKESNKQKFINTKNTIDIVLHLLFTI